MPHNLSSTVTSQQRPRPESWKPLRRATLVWREGPAQRLKGGPGRLACAKGSPLHGSSCKRSTQAAGAAQIRSSALSPSCCFCGLPVVEEGERGLASSVKFRFSWDCLGCRTLLVVLDAWPGRGTLVPCKGRWKSSLQWLNARHLCTLETSVTALWRQPQADGTRWSPGMSPGTVWPCQQPSCFAV